MIINSKSTLIRLFVLFLIALPTTQGCIKRSVPVGYSFDSKKLDQIKVGKTRKVILRRILGSPSIVSDYGNEAWFYVFRGYERIAFLDNKLKEQKIVKITFNDDTTVQKIETFSEDDATNVALNSDTTPTASSDLTIVEQLLGNVGRFNSGAGALSRRHTPGGNGQQ
jgi:outer membrane protein assembly factor BamE (lipoprotein component of BamABCDE complex)